MIFVTVGGQLPFERLIGAVDWWANANDRTDVYAQVGRTRNPPQHILWEPFVSDDEYQHRLQSAELVVSHAGVGTILSARDAGVPLIVMPRRAEAGEHRNDHQLATCRQLVSAPGVSVAMDGSALINALDTPPVLERKTFAAPTEPELLHYVRQVIGSSDRYMAK